jgi:hypothetical protein
MGISKAQFEGRVEIKIQDERMVLFGSPGYATIHSIWGYLRSKKLQHFGCGYFITTANHT